MNKEFWENCTKAHCVIVPIKIYTDYDNGNLDESKKIGIKYAALPCDNDAVGPHYWFMIDNSITGRENYYDTPEEALKAYIDISE